MLPSYIIEPIWEQLVALLPERERPPLGCHHPRIPDRVVFEKLMQVLMFGCAYEKVADESCSATTLRRRRDEWIEEGVLVAFPEGERPPRSWLRFKSRPPELAEARAHSDDLRERSSVTAVGSETMGRRTQQPLVSQCTRSQAALQRHYGRGYLQGCGDSSVGDGVVTTSSYPAANIPLGAAPARPAERGSFRSEAGAGPGDWRLGLHGGEV